MVLESFLGETLVTNDGTEFKTSELSTEKGGVIGIYFSAHWCPPCREFTPKLASIYNELKDAGKDFEIVFVSRKMKKKKKKLIFSCIAKNSTINQDEESFKGYLAEQPWLAIPYANDENKDVLKEKYQVQGIPRLVLLEADTGNTITTEGRKLMNEFGAPCFPFTQEHVDQLKQEVKEKKEAALKELADLKCLGKLATRGEPDKELDLHEVTRKSEALAIAFMGGPDCPVSSAVLPKLLDCQQQLGKDKLSVIVVPMMKDGEDDFNHPDISSKMHNVPMIPHGARAQAVVDAFKPVLKDIETPHVLVVDARDEAGLKVYEENAAMHIYFCGADAFPWTEESGSITKVTRYQRFACWC